MMCHLKTIIFYSLLVIPSLCKSCFRAGVYEHILINPEEDQVKDGDIYYYLRKNLNVYKQVAEIAQKNDVRILVFPEGGLFRSHNRSEAAKLSENIPLLNSAKIRPCDDERFKNTDTSPGILKFLSCLARDNKMYLIVDLSDIQPCEVNQKGCPKDGNKIFNTAVVFDPNGFITQKYHKRHLFGEFNYDVPDEQELVTFNTPWGDMGLFICFDIIYRDPGLSLIRQKNVTTLLLPTAWYDEFPFLMSSQYHNAWATGNNVNLLAANLKGRSRRAVGSGIYSGHSGPLVYKHDTNEDGIPSLLTADVPIDPKRNKCNPHSKIIPIDYGKSDTAEYPIMQVPLAHYTHVNLTGENIDEKLCEGTFCCSLIGKVEVSDFKLVFGLTNKIRSSTTVTDYSWCEEGCFVMAVTNSGLISLNSSARFEKLGLEGNFNTDSVYPSVLGKSLKLVRHNEWNLTITGEKHILSIGKDKIISMAGLYGRCYTRDPPYQRSHVN